MNKIALSSMLLALISLGAYAQQSAPTAATPAKGSPSASAQGAAGSTAVAPSPGPAKATAATPAPAPTKATLVFATVDADKDGRISFVEAKKAGMPTDDFRRADADRDGYISDKEWKAAFGN